MLMTVSMNGALKFRPGLGDDADRLAEPHQQNLLGLAHREQRAVSDNDDDEQRDQRHDAGNARSHRVLPAPGCGCGCCGARLVVNSFSGRTGTTLPCPAPPS